MRTRYHRPSEPAAVVTAPESAPPPAAADTERRDARTSATGRTHDDATAPSAGPGPPVPSGSSRLYPASLRWGLTAAAAAVGVASTVASGFLDDSKRTFLLAHGVTALPFLLAGLACTRGALRGAPPEYRPFWRPWFAATCLSTLAALAAVVGVVAHMRVFVALDVALMVASTPLWALATVRMLRIHAGRLSVSIDLVDGLTALLVLGAPWLLVVAEPLARADELLFAIPFVAATVLAPAGLYLAFVDLSRVPAIGRVPHGIGLALGAAFTVSITMQLAHAVASIDLPLPAFIGLHCLVMALVLAASLWATGGAGASAPAPHAFRPRADARHTSPMPAFAAAVLPLLGAYVFATRGERPWGVPFFVMIVLLVVVLNAVRHAALAREARRLQARLADAAEERGRLLAAMLRALEDDRHRTASELHAQAVGSLTTLGTIIQTAAVTLPPATASAVTETIEGLQGDLADRAEQLRQLMVAMRSPAFSDLRPAAPPARPSARVGGGGAALAAALRAYAADLVRDREAPVVTVDVDESLHLDWSTMTIAYRIAQEALANATRHADAARVDVQVRAAGCGIEVAVCDDGRGFTLDPDGGGPGSGLTTMELFASLGRGELAVGAAPGGGTEVRSVLGTRRAMSPSRSSASAPSRGADGRASRPHLHVVRSTPS
jgi:two-component system, NarL family, sensor histidine kinase UhpB